MNDVRRNYESKIPCMPLLNATSSYNCISALWEMWLTVPISELPAHLAFADRSVAGLITKKNDTYLPLMLGNNVEYDIQSVSHQIRREWGYTVHFVL